MKFRPCIDIHNGAVKQIVGGSLKDKNDTAQTNFTSVYGADYYADMYKEDGLRGGHIILLNPATSPYYADTKAQAFKALRAYPGGMQLGGGITAENAEEYLEAGASHVIVTSYVFRDGEIKWDNLKALAQAAGRDKTVLDLSCRRRGNNYYIVTERWQTFTNVSLSSALLDTLAEYCAEFLIHGVDVEGKGAGMDEGLVRLLATWDGLPITYAGGIGTVQDLDRFAELSQKKLDFTIGSALDLFGGSIPYADIRKL